MEKQKQLDLEKEKLKEFDKAMRRIKDATGVADVNEIIQKFSTQTDTLNNLNEMKAANERKIAAINEEKIEIQKQLERLKFEGIEAMTRRQIDEVEKNVVQAELKYERNKDRFERIHKVLVAAKAGVEHITDKLKENNIDGSVVVPVATTNIDDALTICETKIARILGELKSDPDLYEEIAVRVRSLFREAKGESLKEKKRKEREEEQINNNIRVRLPDKDDEDLSDADIDQEAEAEINERMKIKVEAQLRYDRMAKNKMKKVGQKKKS